MDQQNSVNLACCFEAVTDNHRNIFLRIDWESTVSIYWKQLLVVW